MWHALTANLDLLSASCPKKTTKLSSYQCHSNLLGYTRQFFLQLWFLWHQNHLAECPCSQMLFVGCPFLLLWTFPLKWAIGVILAQAWKRNWMNKSSMQNTIHLISQLNATYSRFVRSENSPYQMQRKMLSDESSTYLHYTKAPQNVLVLMIHLRKRSARWVIWIGNLHWKCSFSVEITVTSYKSWV